MGRGNVTRAATEISIFSSLPDLFKLTVVSVPACMFICVSFSLSPLNLLSLSLLLSYVLSFTSQSPLSLLLSYVLSFSGPFKHCEGYGTLQVPKNLNFKQKVDYTTAVRMCQNSDNGRLQVPWQFPAATECMSSFVRKMKDQFSLTVIPDVWWWHPEPHNTPVTGLKHVVCFVCKSYRLKNCAYRSTVFFYICTRNL